MAAHKHDHAHDHAHDHGHDHAHDHDHGHDHDHDHEHGGTATEERGEQKVKVEDAGPARKALTIEVPQDRIAKKIEENFGKLKTEAAVPGFRRGRAPMRLLEKKFGSSIKDDVRGQIISECYQQAIEDEKLEVIGEPEVKDIENLKLPDSGPMTFRVEVEVVPTFDMPALEGIAVKRPPIEVKDEQVNEEVQRLKERFGRMNTVKDADVAAGDYIMADVRVVTDDFVGPGVVGGDEVAHQPSAYILVNGEDKQFKGHVLGLLVNDLGKRLIGQKVGALVTVSITGPQSHEDERIKNKPLTIHIRIDAIQRPEPLNDEQLAQHLGFTTIDEARQRVRSLLEDRARNEQQNAMRHQVAQHLLKEVTVDLPEGLSRRQTARLLHRHALEMAYRGASDDDIQQAIANLRASGEERARRELKLFFILDQAARKLDVDVSEGEVNGAVAMIAQQQGRRPEKLRQEMQRAGQLEQLYVQVRDQKTLDKILEKATVTDGEYKPAAEPEAKTEHKEKGKKKAEKEEKPEGETAAAETEHAEKPKKKAKKEEKDDADEGDEDEKSADETKSKKKSPKKKKSDE